MRRKLDQKWQLCECEANSYDSPAELNQDEIQWLDAIVPGTVASTLQQHGMLPADENIDIDAKDWWYRTEFNLSEINNSQLQFEGLATLCDIWLNGELIGSSENMFLPLMLQINQAKRDKNQLYLHFKSLDKALSDKKPRPRWKTNLVDNQKLRYFRTTLLGRIPGWSGNAVPVGPWRDIEITSGPLLSELKITPSLSGTNGKLSIFFQCKCKDEGRPEFRISIGDQLVTLHCEYEEDAYVCRHTIELSDVTPWYPHTHGSPFLYEARLLMTHGDIEKTFELSPIGFRSVELNREEGRFSLSINGRKIFCRGACWTPADVISLNDDAAVLRKTLRLLQSSGANMLRVGGTMVYASKHLLELCDEMGILVWHDFQFANMDYPAEEEAFSEIVRFEINEQIRRQSIHACLALYCGNSEVNQQASMMGLASSDLDELILPRLVEDIHRNNGVPVPLITTTPDGGSLPFHTDTGVSHYYAVGAYKKSLQEIRQHNVQFTSECLGFSNVPQRVTRDLMFPGKSVVAHHPAWKAGIPRDSGAGWDFEDVRDHYLNRRYGVDAIALRCQNPDKYMSLSEVISGEMMSRVMQEWRSTHSNCEGALVWFLKDLKPGAGWGIIDSYNRPKASYYLLKHCWQPVCVSITDEGPNGLHFHVINESNQNISGSVILKIFKKGNVEVASGSVTVSLEAGDTIRLNSTTMLGGFFDINYCYQFGPLDHDVISIEFFDEDHQLICDNFHFIDGREVFQHPETSVDVVASKIKNDCIELRLEASHFLYRVNLDIPDYLPDDNFFNLLPDNVKQVTLRPIDSPPDRFRGYLSAINLEDEVRISAPADG